MKRLVGIAVFTVLIVGCVVVAKQMMYQDQLLRLSHDDLVHNQWEIENLTIRLVHSEIQVAKLMQDFDFNQSTRLTKSEPVK